MEVCPIPIPAITKTAFKPKRFGLVSALQNACDRFARAVRIDQLRALRLNG